MKEKLLKIKNYVKEHKELQQVMVTYVDMLKAAKELQVDVLDIMSYLRYGKL